MKFSLILLAGFFLLVQNCFSQSGDGTKDFSLQEIVDIARTNSIVSLQAATLRENGYWQWRNFKSFNKPHLVMDGILTDYNRVYNPITQPDGNILFQPVLNNNSRVNLTLSQNITAFGTRVFFRSTLLRFDDFESGVKRYSSEPVVVGFEQPIFSFNRFRWDARIEPLRFEESKRQYNEDLEQIAVDASELYFNMLLAQINFSIARHNLSYSDTLYKIGEVKYEMGKLSKSELLRLKLLLLNSHKALGQSNLSLETSSLELKSYLGVTDSLPMQLLLPTEIPQFSISVALAVEQAEKNRRYSVAFTRQRLEAERDLAEARRYNGLNVNLVGTIGLSSRSGEVAGLYGSTRQQQRLRLGFEIPLMQWGRAKSRVKIAEANKKLIEYAVGQNEVSFHYEIYTHVELYNVLKDQVMLTMEADSIAQEKYKISQDRYLVGDISLTDLNIAMEEKDIAKREFISSLRNLWQAYYKLRLLTLYDFENNRPLKAE